MSLHRKNSKPKECKTTNGELQKRVVTTEEVRRGKDDCRQ